MCDDIDRELTPEEEAEEEAEEKEQREANRWCPARSAFEQNIRDYNTAFKTIFAQRPYDIIAYLGVFK